MKKLYRKSIAFEVLTDFDPKDLDERDLLVCLDAEVLLTHTRTEVLNPSQMRRLLAKYNKNPDQFETKK